MTKRHGERLVVVVCAALVFLAQHARAHHSPSEVIERLTQQMAEGQRTAILLVRRADEYRALGDDEAAVADYQSALQLEGANIPALYGLAQAYVGQARLEEAHTAAQRGIEAAANADVAAPFYAVAAAAYGRQQAWEQAVAAWKNALDCSQPKVDWYLEAARALVMLNKMDEARRSLEQAMTRNASTVLLRAWIEMLIRCRDISEASSRIEAGLARARWKSSWLLLRARLELARNRPEAARRDARAALEEIDARSSGQTVNPFLAADKALALTILGRHEEAQLYAIQARARGVPEPVSTGKWVRTEWHCRSHKPHPGND